jgi:4-diphosphocytidyl-2-C-methyl-D-erythritol kinase
MPSLLAPAKVNLTLEVLARRDDGYHTLRSVMAPLALYDEIAVEPAATPSFSSDDPALGGGDNLVLRALAAAGVSGPLALRLHKAIPVGGGLGGGSSDAAAILRAAMDGSLGPAACNDWLAAARSLGSDVPFFLAGTAALVEGVGERVTPLGALPQWWFVVVRPPAPVATADAYRLIDRLRETAPAPTRPRASSSSLALVDALQRADFPATLAMLENDFDAPIAAAYPAVAAARGALLRAGAERPLLSGSGSCLFALFESEARARECASRLAGDPACAQVFAAGFHRDEAWR